MQKINVLREVTLLLVGGGLVFGALHAFRSTTSEPPRTIMIGDRLVLPFEHGFDRMFILALDTRDRYSSTEIDTFGRLLAACRRSHTTCSIIVPEASQIPEIKRQSSEANEIHVVPFHSLNIKGTPTAVLLDRAGFVQGLWEGVAPFMMPVVVSRLSAKRHTLATMDPNSAGHASEPWIVFTPTVALFQEVSDVELDATLQTHTLLDVRTREEFAHWHMANAVNIPLDELSVRAGIELDHNRPVVVDCTNTPACPLAYQKFRELGFSNPLLLDYGVVDLSCHVHSLRGS